MDYMTNLHVTLTPFKNESRVLKETKALAQSGSFEHVFVIAMHEAGLPEHEEINSKQSVWRVKLKTRSWSKRFFAQIIKYFEFCWRVIAFAQTRKVTMVNIHCLDLLPLGVFLKYYLRSKLVYDTHELETETEGNSGIRKSVSKLVERTLIRFVDLTFVVGGEIERFYRNEYSLTAIHSVLNCPPYTEVQKNQLLRDEYSIPEGKKILLYVGGLTIGRGIEFLLDIIENFSDDNYVIVFMGYGELEDVVKERSCRCSRIYFKPAVPPSQVIKFIASADIGLSIIEDSCLSYRYCLPNKLFECIMGGIPVITTDLPEMKNIVLSNRIGAVMERIDSKSFYDALCSIEQMDQVELKRNLRSTAKKYSWEGQETGMMNAYLNHLGLDGREGVKRNG